VRKVALCVRVISPVKSLNVNDMKQTKLAVSLLVLLVLVGCDKPAVSTQAFAEPEVGFRAQGNEPFWTVVVADEGLLYKTPEHLSGNVLAATKKHQHGAWVYTAEWAGQPFILNVQQEPCEDDMSGWQFNYTTQLTVEGQTHKGCGNALGEGYGEP